MLFILPKIKTNTVLDNPLVSVICLCFSQANLVEKAIQSVLHQTYENIELIVIDDASTDKSRSIIEKLSKIHGFQTHFNSSNQGNCRSFNIGLNQSKGKYIIDLAADDQLMPLRIIKGVENLEARGEIYAVDFCDVELIDENGQSKGTHFKRDEYGKMISNIPEGDIYSTLVERYFISAPSMIMRRTVLEELHGYDESLSYEDFDFWIRSSRNYQYAFTNEVLVKKNILSKSLSSIQYKRKNRHCWSTAIVCEKVFKLNETLEENQALCKRISYELRWALITENWKASMKFLELKKKLVKFHWSYGLLKIILMIKPPWYPLWKVII